MTKSLGRQIPMVHKVGAPSPSSVVTFQIFLLSHFLPCPHHQFTFWTRNILGVTQPHSSLRMSFSNRSIFERPLFLHHLKEGVQ